jgi:peroxiredoxin (alkyl hydroperoxide reductase subunit C)
VQHETINNFPLGRNIDETLRLLDALIYVEQHGEVCPANWQQGQKAMKPTRESVAEYLNTK